MNRRYQGWYGRLPGAAPAEARQRIRLCGLGKHAGGRGLRPTERPSIADRMYDERDKERSDQLFSANQRQILVLGDFNAKSVQRFGIPEDRRERRIHRGMGSRGGFSAPEHSRKVNTCVKAERIYRKSLLGVVCSRALHFALWRMMEDVETRSDHKYMYMVVLPPCDLRRSTLNDRAPTLQGQSRDAKERKRWLAWQSEHGHAGSRGVHRVVTGINGGADNGRRGEIL